MVFAMSVGFYTHFAGAVTADDFPVASGRKASFDEMPTNMATSMLGYIPSSIPAAVKKELFSSSVETYPQDSITPLL